MKWSKLLQIIGIALEIYIAIFAMVGLSETIGGSKWAWVGPVVVASVLWPELKKIGRKDR